ncbi:MAG: hypothetical protein ACTJLM_02980 [Ehrlichia sp.]
MESVKNPLSNDEIKKTTKTTKRRKNTTDTTTKCMPKKQTQATSTFQEPTQDVQQGVFNSINLKKVESDVSEEIIYGVDTSQDDFLKTKQPNFFKGLWYSLKGYFSQ